MSAREDYDAMELEHGENYGQAFFEMCDEIDDLRAKVHQLANALWPYRDDWDENSGSAYNTNRKAETQVALDAARKLGWYPK